MQMKNNITFNPKRDLPYLAALAQIVQFTIAGYTLFGPVGILSGLFLGALVSMTVAYATSQYSEIAKERKKAALFFMVVLLAFSPIVVGTAAYIELPFTGVWAGIVAAAWGILPDFSVALDGFIAGRGLVKRDEQPQSEAQAKPKKVEAVAEPLPVAIEQPAPSWVCATCGYVAKSQAALSGHQIKHSRSKAEPSGYTLEIKPMEQAK